MKTKPQKTYFTGIDGIRALAVVGVILYHINPNQFIGGYLGVLVFFVLSGYFITNHLIKNIKQNNFSFKSFYIKRIKRIYPQLISVLSLTSIYILLFQRNLLHNLYQIVISNLLGVYNFWQIMNGQSYFERFSQDESPFVHLWTLSIEWQYYLIWPIILVACLYLFKKIRYTAIVTVIIAIASAVLMSNLYHPGIDTSRIYYGTDTRLFALMIGSLLAMIWPAQKLKKDIPLINKSILNTLGAISLILMCTMSVWPQMNPQNGLPYQGGMVIFTIVVTVLVAIILHPAASFNKLLTNPIFSYLGSRSYGIYLYQFPIMVFFESSFKHAVIHHPRLVAVSEIVLILIISEISHQLIEKNINKLTVKSLKNQLENFKKIGWKLQFKWLLAAVGILGLVSAVSVSPFAKANVNPNPLEQAVTDNVRENKKHNAIVAAQSSDLFKGNVQSVYLKASKLASSTNLNNTDYSQFGLSSDDLQILQNLPVTAIGDSVMAGSSNGLRPLFPKMVIDAAISRQMIDGLDILKEFKQQGLLSPIVLMALGTNGPFTTDDLKSAMTVIGSNHQVFWVNVHVPNRPWQDNVNETLNQFAKQTPNFKVIDWYDYSNHHTDWFIDDLTHLNPLGTGPNYYGSYIAKSMLETLKSQN